MAGVPVILTLFILSGGGPGPLRPGDLRSGRLGHDPGACCRHRLRPQGADELPDQRPDGWCGWPACHLLGAGHHWLGGPNALDAHPAGGRPDRRRVGCAGTGNLRTATVGAGSIALVNWLTDQLRMPIAGPMVETPFLLIGLLADRWKNMTWYMIAQARRGNLLALPDEMQLPMLVRVWQQTSWPVRIAGALGMLAVAAVVYLYIGFYVVGRVPEGTAIVANAAGTIQVTRYGSRIPVALAAGETLRPGDMVTTGRDAQALLRFADGTECASRPIAR